MQNEKKINELVTMNTQAINDIALVLGRMNEIVQNITQTAVDASVGKATEIVNELKDDVKSTQIKTEEIGLTVDKVKDDVDGIKDTLETMPSPRASYELIQRLRKKVVGNILGGTKSPQYVLISGRIFGNLNNVLTKHFKVSSYKDLPYSKVEEAKKIIISYTPHPYWIESMWNELLLTYENGELSIKRENAMKELLKNELTLMDVIN